METRRQGVLKELVERIESVAPRGDRFAISMTVLGELYYAVYASRRRDQNLEALKAFLNDVVEEKRFLRPIRRSPLFAGSTV